jgi:hypothetical protein
MNEQSSGLPSSSADLVQDIDAAVQADTCEYCSIGNKVSSFSTLFMNVSATGKFAPDGFPIN